MKHDCTRPAVRKLLRVAQVLWCAPLSAVALPIVLIAAAIQPRQFGLTLTSNACATALWAHSPGLAKLLRHHPMGRMRAITIGQVVLADCAPSAQDAALVVHELRHVRQALVWGVLFPWVYLGSSVKAVWRGQDSYWQNAYEMDARAAEVQAVFAAHPLKKPSNSA